MSETGVFKSAIIPIFLWVLLEILHFGLKYCIHTTGIYLSYKFLYFFLLNEACNN